MEKTFIYFTYTKTLHKMVAPSSHLRKGSKCEGRNFDFELSAEYLKERGITFYESQSKIIVPTFDVKKNPECSPGTQG